MISYLFGRNDFGVFGDEWLLKNFVTVKYENRDDLQINFERHKKIETPKIEYVSEEELDSYGLSDSEKEEVYEGDFEPWDFEDDDTYDKADDRDEH